MIDPTSPDYTNTPVSGRRPVFGYTRAEECSSPALTIITPFYNSGAIFHETARSVFQQSLQQWEWLIINDGSTDPQSLALLDLYRHRDPRVRVLDHRRNNGLSAARNTGFRAARAPYVVQLDSDDLLEPTAIEKWFWFLESHPECAFVKGHTVGFGAQEYLWRKGFHDGSAFLEANLVNPTSAIRTAVHEAVGGYDETDHGGLMDWDFWLRCASRGYWGGTVPEYLDWYRRRPLHNDRWPDFDDGERQQAYREKLREKYAGLWQGQFPTLSPCWQVPYDTVPDTLPCENHLRKQGPRLLLIIPWLEMGGAEKFDLDVLEQLTQRGWEVTVVVTLEAAQSWLPQFARFTPDIFILRHFLRLADYPRFVRYLIQSRQVDVVMVTQSECGYLLLPYLRTYSPGVAFVDFCHIVEEHWKNGGYPRLGVDYQELLDLNLVSCESVREWMVRQGANPRRIRVCYTNVDPELWRPDPERRVTVREELELDNNIPLILYAGRICSQKQPRVFAQTLLQLSQQGCNYAALVAGDGSELEWLLTFVQQHGLEAQVRLLGTVTNERMRELMMAADVFFLPSRQEGIALAIYEAMACGLPIVGAAVGGQSELVTPECGVLVARSDEESEARQYARVLAEFLQDPEGRQARGQAGRERVKNFFRLEKMAETFLSLLHEAQQLHSATPRPLPSRGVGRVCAIQATTIHEQTVSITELGRGQAWLEEQRARWQQRAEEYERMFREQKAWTEELEKGKAWLEEHWVNWKRVAGEREALIQEQEQAMRGWRERIWGRLRVHLRGLRLLDGSQRETKSGKGA